MKNLFILMVLIFGALAFSSFQYKGDRSDSVVGDVKYSILPPEQFKKINGDGWILADGRSIKGSRLQRLTGILNAPDARGMFLRGLNYDRQDDLADPFFKEHKRARQAGEYQNDIVGPHSHGWTGNAGDGYPNKAEQHHTPEEMRSADPKQKSFQFPRGSEFGYAISGVGTETRPKNIALYIYIKIN